MQTLQNQQDSDESYEFSFRRDYGIRLFVRVPAESLAVFRRVGAASRTNLRLVFEHHAALCEVAIQRSCNELTTVVEITEADAEVVLEGSIAKGLFHSNIYRASLSEAQTKNGASQ